MALLYLFYLFITFSIGMLALGFAGVIYHKTHEELIRHYLFLLLAFSLAVLARILLLSISTSRVAISPYLIDGLEYLEKFIAPFLLMLAFPVFSHALFAVSNRRIKNSIFLGLAMLTYSLGHFFEFAMHRPQFRQNMTNLALFSCFLYIFMMGIMSFKHIHEQSRKILARKVLILLGIFVPLAIHDEFLAVLPILHPLGYIAMCLVLSHHFFTHSFQHVQLPQESKPDVIEENTVPESSQETSTPSCALLPDANFLQQFEISPREQELVPLVLQGCTNQQIGDTLCISLSTVKTHLRNIYSKLGVKNRYELISFIQQQKQ